MLLYCLIELIASMKKVKPATSQHPGQGMLGLPEPAKADARYEQWAPVSISHDNMVPREPVPDNYLPYIRQLLELFSPRLDVYSNYWVSAETGRSGYSPACGSLFVAGTCPKAKNKKFKCSNCKVRNLLPLTENVIYKHLKKYPHIGIFLLHPDSSCRTLAVDFDEKEWKSDVLEFLTSCKEQGISAYTEISKSGNGAHVWIFFADFIPAITARKLGLALLSDAQARTGRLRFDSYDRLFPSQDFVPKQGKGYGNTIAMPFQAKPREQNFTVFVDTDRQFIPYQTQLSKIDEFIRVQPSEVTTAITNLLGEEKHELGVQFMLEGDDNTLWRSPGKAQFSIRAPKKLSITLGSGIEFKLKELTPQFMNMIARIAAFPNPLFYMTERNGFSTYGIPMVERRAALDKKTLTIPRGCLEAALEFIKSYNVPFSIKDIRSSGSPIHVEFRRTLRSDQVEALEAMAPHDVGTLKAPPSFGKTVLSAAMIARRKVSTLIVVHRKSLARQWRNSLTRSLDLKDDQIGQVGGLRHKPSGVIDIVMLQTLGRIENLEALSKQYGQVIIDECHHIAAPSFEVGFANLSCRYFLGLSATPKRSDGRQPLVFMIAGNVKYVSKRPLGAPEDLTVKTRTRKKLIQMSDDSTVTDLYTQLVMDTERTQELADEAVAAFARNRKVVMLTGRKNHTLELAAALKGKVDNLFVMDSYATDKERDLVLEQMEALDDDKPRVLISTWQLVGEGFDHAPLNTLILCLPFSWEGTLEQCAGRLDRYLPDKHDAEIIDFIDDGHPVTRKMWKARRTTYKRIKYRVIDPLATMDLFD